MVDFQMETSEFLLLMWKVKHLASGFSSCFCLTQEEFVGTAVRETLGLWKTSGAFPSISCEWSASSRSDIPLSLAFLPHALCLVTVLSQMNCVLSVPCNTSHGKLPDSRVFCMHL